MIVGTRKVSKNKCMTLYEVAQNSKQPKSKLRFDKNVGSIVVQNPKLFSRQKNKMEKKWCCKNLCWQIPCLQKIIFTWILFHLFKIIHQLPSSYIHINIIEFMYMIRSNICKCLSFDPNYWILLTSYLVPGSVMNTTRKMIKILGFFTRTD